MAQPPTCPWCGKVSFLTRAAASWRARARVRLRVYCCPAGQGWHLTSRRPRRRGSRQPGARRTIAGLGWGERSAA